MTSIRSADAIIPPLAKKSCEYSIDEEMVGIRRLYWSAFPQETEIVATWRWSAREHSGPQILSLVAEMEDAVVGHCFLFSRKTR